MHDKFYNLNQEMNNYEYFKLFSQYIYFLDLKMPKTDKFQPGDLVFARVRFLKLIFIFSSRFFFAQDRIIAILRANKYH